jgi:hypothetical protein
MRVAPPVQALSCSAGPWRSIQLALYASSAVVAVGWAAATLWKPGAGALAAGMLAGLVAWRVARRALPVHYSTPLAWDGTAWQLQPPGADARGGQVALMLDLDDWMLVRFSPAGAGRFADVWLPLSRRDTAAAWPLLRVALHAPQPAA